MDAVQHGHLPPRHAGGSALPQPGNHGLGLLGLRLGAEHAGRRPRLALGFQPDGSGDPRSHGHRIGQRHDLRGRAIVAHQPDQLRPGKPAGEAGEVLGAGPGEGVDGLGWVAHHAQILRIPAPQLQQCLLDGADVLVLVHHQVPVGRADLLGDARVVAQQGAGAQQDVVEVDHPAVRLHLLVTAQHPADHGRLGARHIPAGGGGQVGVLGGDDVAHLRPGNLGEQVAQQPRVRGQPQPADRFGDQRQPGVGDRRQLRPVGPRPEVLGLPQRRGVEGARRRPGRPQRPQPRPQLPRRPRGEGDRQHRPRLVGAGVDAVGDPVRDRPRLARPGAGDHAHRHAEGGRDLGLLGVEARQQGVGVDRHEEHCRRRCRHRTPSPRRLPSWSVNCFVGGPL